MYRIDFLLLFDRVSGIFYGKIFNNFLFFHMRNSEQIKASRIVEFKYADGADERLSPGHMHRVRWTLESIGLDAEFFDRNPENDRTQLRVSSENGDLPDSVNHDSLEVAIFTTHASSSVDKAMKGDAVENFFLNGEIRSFESTLSGEEQLPVNVLADRSRNRLEATVLAPSIPAGYPITPIA